MFRNNVVIKVLAGSAFLSLCLVIALSAYQQSTFIERVAEASRLRRQVEANQRKPRQIMIQFTDTGNPGNAVETVGAVEYNLTDSATGTYIVSLNEPFYRAPIVMCVDATSATSPNGQCVPTSVTKSGFRIYCADGDSLGTLINPGIVNCMIQGWDAAEDFGGP